MVPLLRGRRKWTSLTELSSRASGRGDLQGAVVAVCGEGLDGELRAALAATVGEDQVDPDSGGGASALVIIEELCGHRDRVSAFWQKPRPKALVVVGCTLRGAADAVHEAIASGLDPAYATAMSLAPALAQDAPDARSRLVTATCRAGSRRARLLVHQPRAGRVPWQAGQSLDRRGLLGAWRGLPSLTAHIDDVGCLGAERCGRCLSDCPVGAIRTEGAVLRVDSRACISCGRCVTTCPVGAISMPGADLAGLTAQVDTLLAAGVDDLAVVCERQAIADSSVPGQPQVSPQAVVSLPCIAMLSPGTLIGLQATGMRLHVEACDNCRCHDVIEANATFADRLESVLRAPDRSAATGADQSGCHLGRVAVAPAVSSVGDGDVVHRQHRLSSESHSWNEPAATNAGVAALLVSSEGHSATEQPIFDDGAATRVVQVDDARCTLCGSCALACPSSALAFDAAGQVLAVDSSECVGCGRCVVVCPEAAVKVDHGVDITSIVHGPTPVSVPRRRQVCARCGTTVAADPIVASVQRRLAAQGKPPALIASLQRCPVCASSGT